MTFDTELQHGDRQGFIVKRRYFLKFIESEKDVAPPLHISTIFERNADFPFIYSREDTPTRHRLELLLSKLECPDNSFSVTTKTFSSGVAAQWAILVALKPKRILMRLKGLYHGFYGVLKLLDSIECVELLSDKNSGSFTPFQTHDIIWIESAQNPCGQVYDIPRIAALANAANATLIVDGTWLPPPLQFALVLGAHIVVHSATKYFGGHSDIMMGTVSIRDNKTLDQKLMQIRTLSENVPGPFDTWLLLRSLRTLSVRVQRQSNSATILANRLRKHPSVIHVWHAATTHDSPTFPQHFQVDSVHREMGRISRQLKLGACPVFSIELKTASQASQLPFLVSVFRRATSLGGVESLIDYRYSVDKETSPTLVRLSIGLEDVESLWKDLCFALENKSKL